MKKIFTILTGNGLIATFSVVACFLAITPTNAAQLTSARVTQIIQDVKLLPSNAAPRPAAVNDDVRQGTAVRTGQDSRTELTFTDKTLTRLGANSVFSFDSGAGIFNLGHGSILMQVPPNGSSVKVKTAAVTAAITGGTAIFGSGPPVKFMVLEGTGTFYPNDHPDEAMILHGGEMATLGADGHMIGPTTFNVKLVLETSELIVPFDDLANLGLIWDVILGQLGNPQIVFNDLTQIDAMDQAQNAMATPAPSETPSKFGAPSTISSPDPYVITSGTQIQTDPSITTNGVTDLGKIYRGPALDGSEYDYLFGSTSSFDSTIGTFFNTNGNGVPVAVFKFSSLQLTGNPTINIPTGSPTFLGLVSVGDVTSGAPGGTVSFAGLDRLFIATQNGSINLGPEISFSNIGHVVLYARGSGSNLTLGSAISGAAVVHLFSEGTVQVNGNVTTSSDFKSFSGGDFLVGSGVITADSIDVESLGNIDIDSSLFPNPPGGGSSVIFNAANTLNLQINGGGTFGWDTLNATANMINLTTSEGVVTFDFSNSSAVSFIAGSGGINASNIDLNGGGNLTATANGGGDITFHGISLSGSVTGSDNVTAGNNLSILNDVTISRTNGGSTSGLNVTLSAGTDLTVGGNLSLSTDASNIQNGGNISVTSGENTTIGGSFLLHTFGLAGTATGNGGNIAVHTGGDLLAGDLDFTVDYNTPDVSVNNGANLTLNVGGNLTTTQGGVDMIIYTPIAGTLTNGGNLSLSVGGDLNTAKGGNLNLTVVNTISTTVPNGANLFASIGGDLNANAVNAQIENDLSGGIGTGGNLTFNVSGDLNASSLLVQLSNTAGGHIANGGNITFHVGGDLTVAGDANFLLSNGGGTIGGDAAVTLSAVNVSANSLTAEIDNNGGVIGSSATINSNISGNVNVINDVTFEILGSGETTPVEAININGGTYDIGGTFLATIDGNGAITLNNANIRADTIKITAFGANGTLNIGGGTISADTMLKLYAAGSNGSINFVANVTLNSQSTATLIQAVSVTIVNGVIVTIAGPAPADVFTDHPNYSSTDTSGNPTGGNDNTTGKFAGSGAHTSPFAGSTPTPTPSGTPSKFGPPTTIASPVPYVITGSTVIQTDPAITTNGVTDYGKIWRGPDTDGPLSAFIFGSTSSFDTSSGFDVVISGNEGGAGFKFTALQLTGDPTVSTTNGEINLGLIAVNGITSGAPGGVLTFAGIRGLLLATQNGPITLGPEISFSGLHDINIYARGSSSDLTLGSDISTSSRAFLLAERDMSITSSLTTEFVLGIAGRNIALLDPAIMHAETIMLFAGQDLTWNGQISDETALNTDGNVDISAGNQISITNALEIDRRFGGSPTGLNVSFDAGTDLTAGNGLTILVDNSVSGNLDSGANITLNTGGNLTVNGSGDLSLTVANNDGGHIGIGGSISVTTGVNLTAGSLSAFVNDRHAGSIDGDSTVGLSVGGALTISNDVSVGISTRNDGTGGGTIGSNATVDISAASVSVGGGFTTFVSTAAGGSITGNASNTVNVTGDLVVQGPVFLEIADTGFNQINPINFIAGGHIGGDATVTLSAQNITTFSTATGIPGQDTMALEASIYPNGSGTIGGNATVNVFASQNISAPGTVFFTVANGNFMDTGGGTIGGNAEINVSAVNLSTGALFADIYNYGGASIGNGPNRGSAAINFGLTGALTTTSNAEFLIDNSNGGIIGSDATIGLALNTISILGSLSSEINNLGGQIGGAAVINADGDINVTGNAFFQIFNFGNSDNLNNGAIGGNAAINLSSAASIGANSLSVVLNNSHTGQIGGSATIDVGISGNISTQNDTTFVIANNDFGQITGVAGISVTATGISSQTGTLFAQIFNQLGTISGSAGINLSLSGDIVTQNGANFDIWNFGVGPPAGTIGVDAVISVTAGSLLAHTGTLSASILNQNVGFIGRNAIIGFNLSGDIDVGSAEFLIQNGGAMIVQDARISLTAANISVGGNLDVTIDNFANGGTIGGAAVIDMNPSGDVTVTNNATVQVLGSGLEGSAAINFNGGNYDVGGTFHSLIDGDGTITFSNANVHADVIKAEVFGTNGLLKIGGGSLSADSTLRLYAAGSSGSIVFTADVTLSSGSAAFIAANTVTIDNSVTVTINSPVVAQVFTNNPHYAITSGGDGTTSGVFAGTGAPTTTQPFPPPSTSLVSKQSQTTVASSGPLTLSSTSQLKTQSTSAPTSTSKTPLVAKPASNVVASHPVQSPVTANKTAITLTNSAELVSMLDSAPESGNKVIVAKPASRRSSRLVATNTSAGGGNVVRTANSAPDAATKSYAGIAPVNSANNNFGRPVNTPSY
jgi:hypothetical protein